MPDGTEPVTVKVTSRIAEVDAAAWDACAGDDNPFVSHAFLLALEESRSACREEGWLPQHLLIEDEAGLLVAAMPLYLKGHSQGEYVFDHGWAHAYERAGGQYYPKLVGGVPFSPVPGPRLLVRPGPGADRARGALIAGASELAKQLGVSSLHVNFLPRDDWELLGEAGFLRRIGQQYHWHNDGYGSFDDFLGALSSRKRKNIRKERQSVADVGLSFRALSGADLEPRHWDAFYGFYLGTVDRKWGGAYLTRDFFRRIDATMADKIVLILAESHGEPVAGALNLRGRDALYGRNWGASERWKFLHFETCYYRAIDYAIEHGLARVEAGAQGQHKIQRGYLPVETYSAHWIADPGFRRAVADFLERERRAVGDDIDELMELSPFRRGEGLPPPQDRA